MGQIFQNILDTIGNTPTVKINNLGPENRNIYVKIESFNPMGSVKDRLALGVELVQEEARHARQVRLAVRRNPKGAGPRVGTEFGGA